MTVQLHPTLRSALADAYEATIGTAPTVEFRSGPQPADTLATATGTVLGTAVLPSDWMTGAVAGSKSLIVPFADPAADAAGIIGHYRLVNGGICWEQGSVTMTGGGGDITMTNTNVAVGQRIEVTAFTKTVPGA